MFNRRTLLYGVAALALFAIAVTAGKGGGGKPPNDPPADADPAILYIERGHFPDYTLWVMDADGANKTELLSPANFAIAVGDWSPDNAQIVVLTRRADNAWVWNYAIADADGSNMTLIQDGSGNNVWVGSTPGDPQWRVFPNGQERIVFHPEASGGFGIDSWTMKTDGTDHRPLLAIANRNDVCRISRDGTLAAIEYRSQGDANKHVELGSVAIDDDNGPVVESIVPLSEFAGSPLNGGDVWSPDIDRANTMVAVSAGQVANPGLWIIPIASPANAWRVPVSIDNGFPVEAGWLDARTLVYRKNTGKRDEIFTADIYDGQEVRIASHNRNSLVAPRPRN